MNKGFSAAAAAVVLALAGCGSAPARAPGSDAGASPRQAWPAWLQARVAALEREPPANPPAAIYRAQWQGRSAYYLQPRCCDQYSDLYEESGALICHPDGGITGRGDGRCPAFRHESLQQPPLWRDPR